MNCKFHFHSISGSDYNPGVSFVLSSSYYSFVGILNGLLYWMAPPLESNDELNANDIKSLRHKGELFTLTMVRGMATRERERERRRRGVKESTFCYHVLSVCLLYCIVGLILG